MNEVTYTASRMADGNKLFPSKVTILDNGIRVKIPGFLKGEEYFLYYKQIGFVKVKSPLVGYSTLTIATDIGYVTVHGFSKKEVEAIKQAIDEGKQQRIQYVQVGNQNQVEPQHCICDGPTVEIEEGVTSLDSDTLDDCDGPTVEIEEGVTSLDSDTLDDYDGPTVEIEEGVTSLDSDTLDDYDGPTVEIEEGVTSLDSDTLDDYDGPTVEIEEGVTSLDSDTLDDYDGPTVEIEEGVTSLDSDTLDDYDEIGRLVLPSTLEEIDCYAFEDHHEICNIDFSKVTKLRKIPDDLFSGLKNIRSLEIPEGVEVFGEGGAVVYDCIRLAKITLPSSLLKIKGSISQDCKMLEEVDMSRVQYVAKLPETLFWGSQKIKKFIVPQGVTKVPELFSEGECILEELYLPASVEKVDYINGNCDNKIDVYLYAENAKLKSGFFEDVRTLYVPERALRHYTALAEDEDEDVEVRAMPAEKLLVYAPPQTAAGTFVENAVAPKSTPPVTPPMAPPVQPVAQPQPYGPPTAPPDAMPAGMAQKRSGQLFSDGLEELINMAVATGDVSDNKKTIIMRRAISEGEDPDVVEMVIESRLYKQRNK